MNETLSAAEKRAVKNCISYQVKRFEKEKYRLEYEYNAVEGYNPEFEDKIRIMGEAEEFYTNILKKLNKIL